MKEKIDNIIDKLCNHVISKDEAKKELLSLHIVMSTFRVGDDVLIVKDYRTVVIDIDNDNKEITVFDYRHDAPFKVSEDRVSLTKDYRDLT